MFSVLLLLVVVVVLETPQVVDCVREWVHVRHCVLLRLLLPVGNDETVSTLLQGRRWTGPRKKMIFV